MSSNADWELLMMINVGPMIVTKLTGPIYKANMSFSTNLLFQGIALEQTIEIFVLEPV